MTLPADHIAAMAGEIDSRNFGRRISALSMALAAKVALRRLDGGNSPWFEQMLRWNSMATSAGKGSMYRHCLLVNNASMTRAAFFCFRFKLRAMGIVTTRTCLAGIMSLRNYLRKSCWARWIIGMAQLAVVTSLRYRRQSFIRRIGVCRCRSVTSFTSQPFVGAQLLRLENIIVAFNTNSVTGINRFERSNLIDGICPVETVFSK